MKLSPELFEKFAQILEKYDLAEIHIEEEDCELHIVRKIQSSMPMMAQHFPAPPLPPIAAPTIAAAESPQIDDKLELIKSPIVGTAYLASEPGAPTLVKVGDRIEKDQVIIIIEAMKVMNQLKSPVAGVVSEICVSNAKPVEFGEVLIKIQKA